MNGWRRRLAGWVVLGVLAFFLPVGWAVELIEGPRVEVGPQSGQATLRWRTDVAAGGRVQWGTSPGKLTQRQQGPVGTNHAVVLSELKPGTTYHFTVGTARYPLATNAFVIQENAGGVATATVLPPDAPSSGTATSPTAAASGAGGSKASPAAQPQAPPTARTWGSMRTLQDHFERHGQDFGAKDADDYARRAWLFLQRARTEGLPAKRDSEGVLRVYDPATRSFGAYNRNGTTRTYFKPSRRDYFDDQPGRPVNLREER
jgi:hypothetical protein